MLDVSLLLSIWHCNLVLAFWLLQRLSSPCLYFNFFANVPLPVFKFQEKHCQLDDLAR